MEFLAQLVILTVAPSTIVVVIGYLMKAIFERSIDRDLEKYRCELELQSFKHKAMYSLIHEKRAEVIGNLYGRLQRASAQLSDLVAIFQPGGQDLRQKRKRTFELCVEAQNYYFEHRLYIDNDLWTQIETVVGKLHETYVNFQISQDGNEYKRDETGTWRDAHSILRKDLPPLMQALEERFREILGLLDAKKTNGAKET